MNKEELEKEAEQYAVENWEHYEEGQTDYKALKQAYLDSAEPREKRIAELEDKLANADYQLEGRDIKIKELEAHIEKMQEKLKADLITSLKEQMQYSTSPSCTKGMELFIKSIEKWEIKEK